MLSIDFIQLQQARQGLARKVAILDVVCQNDWRTAVTMLVTMFGHDIHTALLEIDIDKDGGYYKAVIKHRKEVVESMEKKLQKRVLR